MNCEQVEELLSAYLDNALASDERRNVALHLQHCSECSAKLADFRRFDALLSQMPRVSPDPALRDRIFFSPEFLELTGTFDQSSQIIEDWMSPQHSTKPLSADKSRRPQLIALPGGRSTGTSRSTSRIRAVSPSTQKLKRVSLSPQGKNGIANVRVLIGVAAAIVFVFLGINGLMHVNLRQQQGHTNGNIGITPPTGPFQGGPLSRGMRFVFLRDGTLWSVLANNNTQPERLSPASVTVSTTFRVSPPLAGRSAGDRLSYIDLKQAFVHTIRSDGQQDITIPQPLLKAGASPASVWDTEEGAAILNSLAWSKDGSMLAFVADPTGTGQTSLYIYSAVTGNVQMVPLAAKGSISQPVWSPDGIRLAFAFTTNGSVSILDYNSQNHGMLNLTAGADMQVNSKDTVLSLDWSPDLDTPAVTWSMGAIGHVHSIWQRHVGVDPATGVQLLASGDFTQAIYSRTGHGGLGSWMLVNSIAGRPGDLLRVDVQADNSLVPLTNGKQVNAAWWSPNGTQVSYLDSLSAGVGNLHVFNLTTGIDALITKGVANDPAPTWSVDSQSLVYSTGSQAVVVDLAGQYIKSTLLPLRGPVSTFLWSITSSHQLIAALNDAQQGIYVIDTLQNTVVQVDKRGINSTVIWTQIP